MPRGFCESFHIEENILELDKSSFLGALSTKKWTNVSSNWKTSSQVPYLDGEKGMKWVSKRQYIGEKMTLRAGDENMMMFFAFRSFDNSDDTWRTGTTVAEFMNLQTSCKCDEHGCPDVVLKCTIHSKS